MRAIIRLGFVLGLAVSAAGSAGAQGTPAKPRSRPRTPPAPAVSTPPASPAPKALADELLAVLAKTAHEDPQREQGRRLLLAAIAEHQGRSAEAAALMDDVEKAILAMPVNPPGDPKAINFGRMFLWWSWIARTMKARPERALASLQPFTDSTNPGYGGDILRAMGDRVDCSQPAQRAALDAINSRFLEAGKSWIKSDHPNLGVRLLTGAVQADWHCGSNRIAAAAAPLIESAIKKSNKRRIDCEMIELRALSRLPSVERALAAYHEDAATDFLDHVDLCESERLRFAAGLAESARLDNPQKAALVAFVRSALGDFKAQDASPPPPATDKKRGASLPSRGSTLYDLSRGSASLTRLAQFDPEGTALGAQRLYELWVDQWKPDDLHTDGSLASIGTLGATLAKSGAQTAWLCTLPAATPKNAVTPEQQPKLRRERLLAAAEIFGACPAEAEAAFQDLSAGDDPGLVASVVIRLSRTHPGRAEALARQAWPQVPEAKRFDFASGVVARLLGVPEP